MVFGLKNFTGCAFMTKMGNCSFDFVIGIVEEVTLNVTAAGAANAAEIPENFNLNLVPKDQNQILHSASLAISSKTLQSNVVGLIAGATPNLFI
jgi:hypothetical protein